MGPIYFDVCGGTRDRQTGDFLVKCFIKMNLEIKEINNKEIWESFLLQCAEKTFLDSWNWGEFQKKEGNKIWRWGIYNNEQRAMSNEQLIGLTLVVKIKAKRGTFMFVPHGPNINEQRTKGKEQIFKILLEELKRIAKKERASFIRIAPILERNEENIKFLNDLGLREAPIHMHPEITWELDIKPSEEEILMKMRKTTRYLIRQAEKNKDYNPSTSSSHPPIGGRAPIEIIQSQNIEDLKIFNEIYQETAHRHDFVPFSLKYLENEFSSFKDDNQVVIFLGKYQNKVVSSAVIIYWQNIGFYHQGASLSEYNKIPVSYLLQWEAIKEAKRRGCEFYNFWGIAPNDSPQHPWYGLSLFKKGFGGYKKEYIKTQDLIISQKYWLNYLIEKLRKIKRGL